MENVDLAAECSDAKLHKRKGEDERAHKNAAGSPGGQPGEPNTEIWLRLDPFRDEVCNSVHSAIAAQYGHEYAK
jgi:hypothetical protein